MPRKGKRRREAQRERKEHLKAEREIGAGVPASPQPRREQPPQRAWRQPAHSRRKRGGGLPVNPWLIGTPAAAIAVVVIAVIAFSGGGGGGPKATPTPDPRLAGATPAASVAIEATGEESGSYYVPDTLTIKAGEVTEIVINNTAKRVSHNLRVSGLNGQYDVDVPGSDDWFIPVVKQGEQGRLVLKMDKPGTYPFQCDFHPQTQKGTLIVQ